MENVLSSAVQKGTTLYLFVFRKYSIQLPNRGSFANCFCKQSLPSSISSVTRWTSLDCWNVLLQVAQRRTGQKFTVRLNLFQGPRPVISGSPNIGDYGGTITIQTPDALTGFLSLTGRHEQYPPLRGKTETDLATNIEQESDYLDGVSAYQQ